VILYEYVRWVGDEARDTFNHWRRTLQKVECVLLDEKINSLRLAGVEALPGLVAGPIKEGGVKFPHIRKMQIGGKFRLRPLLCRASAHDLAKGPQRVSKTKGPEPESIADADLILLLGAREIQGRIAPSPHEAVQRRQAIIDDPKRARLYKPEKL
jgi:hypothetical protein